MKKRLTLTERRSQETREHIFAATIQSLDTFGYAETTYAKVQDISELSRGAITHHFPSKQALVAATAMNLLGKVLQPLQRRQGSTEGARPVYELVLSGWQNMAGSREGRAFVEILVSCRTDKSLRELLSDQLYDWDRQVSDSISKSYVGSRPNEDDAEILWAINRSFLRGLIIHQQFVRSDEYLKTMIERFASMLEKELLPRTVSEDETD